MTLILLPNFMALAKVSSAAVGSVPEESTKSRGVVEEDSCTSEM